MKSYVLIPALAAIVSTGAAAGDFINGQAARMIIGQATFTDQYPGTTARLLGAAGGVAYGKGTLFIADSSRFSGLTPQNHRVVMYSNIGQKLPKATGELNAYLSRCPVCTARSDFAYDFDLVLGQPDFTKNDPAVSPTGLRLPTAVATDGNMLVVADTQNNRVLLWKTIPTRNTTPADIELGQENFTTVRQPIVVNSKSFRGPQGVWLQDGRLFVADTQNHRVLIWNSIPTANNQAADIVLGQPNFDVAPEPDLTKITTAVHANTLLNPVSVSSDGKRLFVTDLGFSRVLIWNTIPTRTQQPADVVIGQPDMDTEGDNNVSKLAVDDTGCASNGKDTAGNKTYPALCEKSLSFPRFALSDGQRLYIADGGNDRVLVFNSIPTSNGASADVVLGQANMTTNIVSSRFDDLFNPDLQRSAADIIPAPVSLAWDPVGQDLYVADPTNRRVLVFSPQSPDIQRDGVRNAASLQIFALSVVTFTAAPKENDEVTINIAKDLSATGTDYKYKATGTDKIADMIKGLVKAINTSNDGVGDPYILAIANPGFNALSLSARKPGDPGFAVNITTKLSDSAQVAVSLVKSNATVQSAQRIAPGTLISIFGKNLSEATAAAPADAAKYPLELAGVQVYVDGNRAPVISVSPNQINTQIPYEVLDTTSVSVWVLTKDATGKVKKVTTAVPVPVTTGNPGIFAESGDEPRRAIAFHSSSSATITVAVDGSITEKDTATITIEDRPYTYTVVKDDTLAIVRDKLIEQINNNGDEKLTASAGGNFQRIVLKAKIPGDAGNGIPVTTSTSTGAAVILTTSKAATCCASVAGAPITEDNPAQAGEVILIYGTGLGVVGPGAAEREGLATGEAYKGPAVNDPREFVSSLVGGRTANVITAGAKPGTIGIYEVVLELNSDLPINMQSQMTIAQNIYTSNIVTIPVVNPNGGTTP